MRRYSSDEDYWLLRSFLREAAQAGAGLADAWPLYRFDYWRWHPVVNMYGYELGDAVLIWESEGKVVAFANAEQFGEAFAHFHPAYRSPELEDSIQTMCEERLADSEGRLKVWAGSTDRPRQSMLERRGYRKGDWPEYSRFRTVDDVEQSPTRLEGYTIRSLGDGLELLERCWASGLAFHPESHAHAIENRDDPQWYRNIQRAPMYRRDLDLVAVAEDGSVAGFATIWFDDVLRWAAFEPVGVVPAHQRRGVGRALMHEGLRRARLVGAKRALVGSYSDEAGGLYGGAGFTEYELIEPWVRDQ